VTAKEMVLDESSMPAAHTYRASRYLPTLKAQDIEVEGHESEFARVKIADEILDPLNGFSRTSIGDAVLDSIGACSQSFGICS